MKDYKISEAAAEDLEDIWYFIAQHDPLAASVFVQQFLDSFELLQTSPKMGRLRNDLREGMRMHSHGRYIILYTESDGWVKVSRVIHGARDLRTALEE